MKQTAVLMPKILKQKPSARAVTTSNIHIATIHSLKEEMIIFTPQWIFSHIKGFLSTNAQFPKNTFPVAQTYFYL